MVRSALNPSSQASAWGCIEPCAILFLALCIPVRNTTVGKSKGLFSGEKLNARAEANSNFNQHRETGSPRAALEVVCHACVPGFPGAECPPRICSQGCLRLLGEALENCFSLGQGWPPSSSGTAYLVRGSHDLYPSGLPEIPRSDAGKDGAVVTGQGEGGMSVYTAGCVGGWPSSQPPASRGVSSPLAPLLHQSPVLPLPALCEAGGLAVCSQLWPCALGRLEDAS